MQSAPQLNPLEARYGHLLCGEITDSADRPGPGIIEAAEILQSMTRTKERSETGG
jgi:hypothetical protein